MMNQQIQGQGYVQHQNINYQDQGSQRRSFSPQDNPTNQLKSQAQMQMSFGNNRTNEGQLQQVQQLPHSVQYADLNPIQEHQYGMTKVPLRSQGFHSNQNSSGNNSLQIGQISSIQNNSANGVNFSDQLNFNPSINYNIQDEINQYASVQSFSPLVNRIMTEEQKFQQGSSNVGEGNNIQHNANFISGVGGGSFAPTAFQNQENPLLQTNHQYQNNQMQIAQHPHSSTPERSSSAHQLTQQQRIPNIQTQINQVPTNVSIKNPVSSYPTTQSLNTNQTLNTNSFRNNNTQNIKTQNTYQQEYNPTYSTVQTNSDIQQNQVLVDRKKIDTLIESNNLLNNQVHDLQRNLDIKEKALQNTYHIAFLDSKDQKLDFMKIIETYVLTCAENEKLSYGYVDKLKLIDELNLEISELIQQKEDWKTLYEGKCLEVTTFQMQNGSIRTRDDQLQKLVEENEKLRQELQVESREKEELRHLHEEQNSIQQNMPEVNLKVCDLEDKLLKILDENEQLNRLLRERVDEVEFLQSTIKQIQDTYQDQSANDTRFQKVIKDLENEIRRMDERMEELIREKENEISAKIQTEEENNQLRMQFQLKRQELEEYKISSGSTQTLEIQTKKKQEQIDDLLLKLERVQRNLSELQEQKETHQFEAKTTRETLIKLEKRYEEKQHENMDLLSKNTELQNQIKQLRGDKDLNFLEKDLKQISFEKKQLEISLNEMQYEKERIKSQLEAARKEIDGLNKQILIQRQKQSEAELQYQDQIEKLKQEQFKESENYRYKAKIEVQEEVIATLKLKISHADDKLNEKQLELEESKLLIKELKTKLERLSMIESTLVTVDKENHIMQQQKEESTHLIQNLQEKILRISIENERLHKVIEEQAIQFEQAKEKLDNQDKFNQIEINKIEEEMKDERIQFQEVIRTLEQQLKEIDNKYTIQNGSEKQQLSQIQKEFLALQQEFQLAIETLKAKDQQLYVLENNYNQVLSGDRSTFIINKLEEKLQILSAENYRLNKIIVDRIRHSNTFNGW